MAEIKHRTIDTNGIKMHIAEAGDGPMVLMLHGFPESWYSWRHQLTALAGAGYHAVAPDVRGYGRTDAPKEIEAYSMKKMTADAIGVLDALGEKTAVVVGHDWGAPMAWDSAVLYPDRFRAVVGMSVPYMPRPPMAPVQLMKQMFGNNFFYIIYFQEPGVAEAELNADKRKMMSYFMFGASGDATPGEGFMNKPKTAKLMDGMPEPKPMSWLSKEDLDYYVSEFERTGFTGGLNRYRNMDRDWEELPQIGVSKIEQPSMFIAGTKDPVIAFTSADSMKPLVPNMKRTVMLEGAGHWTQQERPDEVNKALIDFLKGL